MGKIVPDYYQLILDQKDAILNGRFEEIDTHFIANSLDSLILKEISMLEEYMMSTFLHSLLSEPQQEIDRAALQGYFARSPCLIGYAKNRFNHYYKATVKRIIDLNYRLAANLPDVCPYSFENIVYGEGENLGR